MSQDARVDLLGVPRLLIQGDPVPVSTKQVALIALLLLKGQEYLDRGQLAHLLWPQTTAARARHSLSQAVYSLKIRCPGPPVVFGSVTRLTLRGLASDVAEFEEAMQSGNWSEASRLYRGDFLDGLDISWPGELRTWVEGLRLRYRQAALSAVEELRLDGRPAEAARLTRRLSVVDDQEPLRSSGDPDLLNERPRQVPPFVGRRREMDRLEQLFARATNVGFTGLVIEGEPGIGKTALVGRFARLRVLRGNRVLPAKAFLAEQNLPFGIVAQWLRDLDIQQLSDASANSVQLVGEALPGVISKEDKTDGQVDPGSLQGVAGEYRLLEALRHVFRAACKLSPLVCILDDAHLADAASLGFIHYFARRSPELAMFFVATVRTPCVYGAEPFSGWEGLDRMHLAPLSERDTEALVSRFPVPGALPPGDVIEELSRRTGRNPLLLVSILATGGVPPGAEVPDSVIEFFIPRLDALSRDARLFLAAISLSGESADVGVVARISGMSGDPSNLALALDELEAAALIVRGPEDTVAARHGVVGEIAITRLPPADRKALYGRAARTLDEEGLSHPAVLAVQHDIAGHQASAFDAALTAALASRELHAARECEFFLKLALSNAPSTNAEADIRLQLADLYRRTGRPTEGLDVVSDGVMTSATPLQQGRARAARLTIQLASGDMRQPNAQVRQQIEELSTTLPPLEVAELHSAFAALSHDLGERSFTLAAANQALALISELPPSPPCVIVAIRAAAALGLYSNVHDGLRAIEGLLPAAEVSMEALSRCLAAQATLLVASGRLLEAEATFLRAIELIERCCMYEALFLVHNNLGVCYSELGRYQDGARHLDEAGRIGKEFARPGEEAITADNMAMLHLERGEHELALRKALAAMTGPAGRSPRALFHRRGMIGLCSLELGMVAQAFEAKREIELLFERHEYWSSDVSYVEVFLARMLSMGGDAGAARTRLEAAIEVFRPRDLMAQARLELELARLELKTDPEAALERSGAMVELLRGTGARPHIERFEALADRARLRST